MGFPAQERILRSDRMAWLDSKAEDGCGAVQSIVLCL
jgi:hypothetical protein